MDVLPEHGVPVTAIIIIISFVMAHKKQPAQLFEWYLLMQN
jgi:hypothetical protein